MSLSLDRQTGLLLVLGVATAATLLVAASTSSVAFGLVNTGWNGASGVADRADAIGAESERITAVERYDHATPSRTVALILSPDNPYAPEEADQVRQFVRRGGTLVVADDFGEHSNGLLAAVGADARIDGRLLRDDRHYYRSPAFPVATNVTSASAVSNVQSLTLNYPSFVHPNGATVLVSTSDYAYADSNRNGKVDPSETLDNYPVVTVESVGDGRVIVVSDPSAFVNAMLDRPGNRAFVHSLYSDNSVVYLDYSHAETLPPLAKVVLSIRELVILQISVAAVGISLIAGWPRLLRLVTFISSEQRSARAEAPETSREALVSYAMRRHPDWDEKRVRRIVESLGADSSEDEPP